MIAVVILVISTKVYFDETVTTGDFRDALANSDSWIFLAKQLLVSEFVLVHNVLDYNVNVSSETYEQYALALAKSSAGAV